MEDNELEKRVALTHLAKLIELKPVASSNVTGIGYDENNQLLKVAFKSKDTTNVYLYENVEPEIYKIIVTANSVGKLLSELVIKQKEKYNYIKL